MSRNSRKGRRQNKNTFESDFWEQENQKRWRKRAFTVTDVTSLDISDQGKRNDTGEKPRVLLIKKNSKRYKKLKHLRQESQKPGDIWLLDYVIMNQTTEDHEQETVAPVIMHT